MYYSQAWWCIPVIPAPRRRKQRTQKPASSLNTWWVWDRLSPKQTKACWADGSVVKVLATQVWETEFECPKLHTKPDRQSTRLYSQGLYCVMGGKTGDSLEDPEPARLLYTAANSKETLSQTRWEASTDVPGHPIISMCVPMLTHTHKKNNENKKVDRLLNSVFQNSYYSKQKYYMPTSFNQSPKWNTAVGFPF